MLASYNDPKNRKYVEHSKSFVETPNRTPSPYSIGLTPIQCKIPKASADKKNALITSPHSGHIRKSNQKRCHK